MSKKKSEANLMCKQLHKRAWKEGHKRMKEEAATCADVNRQSAIFRRMLFVPKEDDDDKKAIRVRIYKKKNYKT